MIRRICRGLGLAPKAFVERTGKKWDEGDTVPTDGASGYAKGCIFIKTDGGAGTTLYINEGSETSCDFNAK